MAIRSLLYARLNIGQKRTIKNVWAKISMIKYIWLNNWPNIVWSFGSDTVLGRSLAGSHTWVQFSAIGVGIGICNWQRNLLYDARKSLTVRSHNSHCLVANRIFIKRLHTCLIRLRLKVNHDSSQSNSTSVVRRLCCHDKIPCCSANTNAHLSVWERSSANGANLGVGSVCVMQHTQISQE